MRDLKNENSVLEHLELEKVAYHNIKSLKAKGKKFIEEMRAEHETFYENFEKKDEITKEIFIEIGLRLYKTNIDKFLKSQDFQHEDEFRLLFNDPKTLANFIFYNSRREFKLVNGQIVPIFKLSLNELSKDNSHPILKEIWIGPKNNNSTQTVKNFVMQKIKCFPTIQKSEIPFR
jgi:hypothetical protein